MLQLQKDYGNLQTNDKALQAEIDAKKAEITQLLEDAEKHKGDAYIISKLRKETESLRQIMRGYVRTIDSLGTLNKTLIVEKNNVLKTSKIFILDPPNPPLFSKPLYTPLIPNPQQCAACTLYSIQLYS